MPTCVKCGHWDEVDADFDKTRKICNSCSPHILVEYTKDYEVNGYLYGSHVTVTVENLPDYNTDDDAIFHDNLYGYKVKARKHAAKLAKKYGFIVIYRGLSPIRERMG